MAKLNQGMIEFFYVVYSLMKIGCLIAVFICVYLITFLGYFIIPFLLIGVGSLLYYFLDILIADNRKKIKKVEQVLQEESK